MTIYKERQTGWLLIVPALVMFVVLTFLFAFQLGTRPMSSGGYFIAASILALMLVLMYGMRTEVTDTEVSVLFGVGLIKRIIPVASIQSVEVVTNAWYYGWGIRWIPRGWLYNISGTRGIEIQLKSGRVVRIGSTNPEELARAIRYRSGSG